MTTGLSIPPTPLVDYFKAPLFQGRKGEWLERRLAAARALAADPASLAADFESSAALVEETYENDQPFHPKRHSFGLDHGIELKGGVHVAARLRAKEHPDWRRRIWRVENDRTLDFVYLDRELELCRRNPGREKPTDGSVPGEVLIADLFLANAYDRMPIIGETKVRTDQCSFYALVQALCQVAYVSSPAQRARLVLFGSRDDFVLSEAKIDERPPIDVYLLLVEPSADELHSGLRNAAIELSRQLVADDRVGRRVGRIAWLEGHDDGHGALRFRSLDSATSRHRRAISPDKPED